jgi:hypothetical protein
MSSLFERGLGTNGLLQRFWTAAGNGTNDGIIEQISLSNRGPGDTWPTQTPNIVAFRRVLDFRDARVLAGLVLAGTLTFHLQAASMGEAQPREHDRISDADGVNWFVTYARLESAQSRWRCEVKQGH